MPRLCQRVDLTDRHEKRSQPNIESRLEVNLGTMSEPKVVFVGAKLDRNLKNRLITLVNVFKDIFSWSYEDIPYLNSDSCSTSSATTTGMQTLEAKAKTYEA